MTNKWINRRLLTQADGIYDENGIRVLNLNYCDGSELDTDKYPLLAEKLPTLEEITELGTLTASDAQDDDHFGISCAAYESRLLVGAYLEDTAGSSAGKVYIYDWNGTNYGEVGTLTASNAGAGDGFGVSCAVYGDRLVVGALLEDTAAADGGKVYIYDWNGTSYDEVGTLTASDAQEGDSFGVSCAVYGDRLIVGAYGEDTEGGNAGKVYIYDWNGNSYDEVGTLTASDAQANDYFGISCAVYGDRLIVGAHFEDTAGSSAGKVYIYDWNGTSYDEVGTLTASDAQPDDGFGGSCSVYGDMLAVGAYYEDTSVSNAGKAYIYDWNGTDYDEVGTLTASDAVNNDRFGRSCAAYESRLLVGAYLEDAAATDGGKVYYYANSGSILLPDMDAPTNSPNPYKIISDLYWYQIGGILKSSDDKLVGESGVEEFDLLLCDGTTFDGGVYPSLVSYLGGTVLPLVDPQTVPLTKIVADLT